MTLLDHTAPATSADSAPVGPPVLGTGIFDVDIHPVPKEGLIASYLPVRWRKHLAEYGVRTTNGLSTVTEYPQMFGGAMRNDAWPEDGAYPGSSLELIQKQLLDPFGITIGVLQCLAPGGQTLNPASQALDPRVADVLTRAINDWQLEHLVYPEPRLRASAAVAFEAAEYAVREIERVGNNPGVVSILGLSKTLEPLGSQRYWPIYEAAVAHGLPIQFHLSQGGGHANTGTGWTSYHTEYHVGHTQSLQSQLLSMILTGTFDRFPDLKVMFVEGNVVHYAPLVQRLEYHWRNLRSEVADLERRPSEYIRDHIWASTQPIDEPRDPKHLAEMIEEFGPENVVFASDYPHFDFDSPDTAFPASFPEELRQKILRDNGLRFFGLDG